MSREKSTMPSNSTQPSGTPSYPTVQEYIQYLKSTGRRSAHTIINYERDLFLLIKYLEESGYGSPENQPDYPLDVADTLALRGFITYLLERGNSARSINRRLSALRSFFDYWVRRGRLDSNPTHALHFMKAPKRLPVFLDQERAGELMDHPNPNLVPDPVLLLRDRAMLELMYASGLRVTELVTLKTFQVGLNEGVLRVMGKGNKERLVPFGEEARSWLQRYLQEARGAILAGQQTDDLFVTHRGEGMTRVMFWVIFRSETKKRTNRVRI